MLPFMKPKSKVAGIAVEYRKPDEGKEPESQDNQALEAAADDIMSAISRGDKKALASAIASAFQICESMPHEENQENVEPEGQE